MPKRACCYLFLVLCYVSLQLETVSAEEAKQKPAVDQKTNTQTYEAMLYELGAFPVNKLTRPYFNQGRPGEVYANKGRRGDVHGWLPPERVRKGGYLTASEKKRYGIPKASLPYQRYLSLIDIGTYQKTKDPLLHSIIQFVFDELHERKVKSPTPGAILSVYQPSKEWDHKFLWQLKSEALSGPDVARLYQRYRVPLLLRCLSLPEKEPENYVRFLEQISSDKGLHGGYRFEAYKQLYAWDQEQYRSGYKAFLIKQTEQTPDVLDRCFMNEALLKLGDEDCFAVVRRSLVTDPIYDVRISILRNLKKLDLQHLFLDPIQVLAEEKAKECRHYWHFGNGPGMDVGETEMYHLLKGLLFVSSKRDLSEETVQKIQHARATLEVKKQERRDASGLRGLNR
ncbi:hypothetical protein Pan241w_58530 [Gimesia alba]|uniref:Uncharacterized protein n=1 Tax=Gimesia alba TaxID=2527973 RepID=A0A517RPE1_9PLAN|nr:hypothetical protein [Gimesia alba]QDT45725.1 hypothetical protein Pan241w_58530 [Gimesia alba]